MCLAWRVMSDSRVCATWVSPCSLSVPLPPSSAFQGASTLTGILLTLVVILAGLHLPAGLSGVLMQTLPFSDSIFQNYCTLTNIEERLAEPIMFGNCLISDHKG